MVSEIPDGIHRTLRDKLLKRKIKIVEMEHEKAGDLSEKRIVYRKHLVGRKEKGKKAEKISAFVVKGYESAIIMQLGKTIGIIPEGIYEIEKNFQYTGTEIIWIDKSEFETKWGLSDIYLKDNIKIGAYGSLRVKITDPRNFVFNVVSNKNIVERKQVDDFIFTIVVQAYKQVLGDYSIEDVLRNRDIIKQRVNAKLYDDLIHWGIEVINLEIEGFKLPEEFEQIGDISMEAKLQKKKKEAEIEYMKNQIDVIETKKQLEEEKRGLISSTKSFDREQKILDAESGYEKAKYDAGAQQIHGNVNIDLLEKQQVAKVAGEVKVIKTHGEKEIELAEIEANRDINVAKSISQLDEKKREELKQKKLIVEQKIAKLKEKLEKFDTMLDDGKISEETYKLRITRIEKELRNLEIELRSYV